MKALRLSHPAPIEQNPLKFVDLLIPEPGPGQVRLKVKVCGACHTDLHTVEGEIHPPSLPVTPGHQVVGIVDAVGELRSETRALRAGDRYDQGQDSERTASPQVQIGDRVGVPWLYSACGICAFCQRGEENLCERARFTGFHADGGYAETMLAEARYVLPIPETISDEQAAPLLCAGIIGYRSLRKADAQPGEHIGLFGFGASAHLAIQVARYWGCEVSVFTRSHAHREHALELGAVWVGSSSETPGKQLDRAVIFAPAGEIVPIALEKIRPGGTVAINAIHMSAIPSFPYQTIYGERTLRSVANATYMDGAEFLNLAVEIDIRSTINPYPLSKANQALDDMKHSRFNGEAVLLV